MSGIPEHQVRCTHVRKDGSVCESFAMRGTDPPLCSAHKDPKAFAAAQARGRATRHDRERLQRKSVRALGRRQHFVTLDRALSVLLPVLEGDDYQARVGAVYVLLALFPSVYKLDPHDEAQARFWLGRVTRALEDRL
jgi:hypothetical protein